VLSLSYEYYSSGARPRVRDHEVCARIAYEFYREHYDRLRDVIKKALFGIKMSMKNIFLDPKVFVALCCLIGASPTHLRKFMVMEDDVMDFVRVVQARAFEIGVREGVLTTLEELHRRLLPEMERINPELLPKKEHEKRLVVFYVLLCSISSIIGDLWRHDVTGS